MDVQAKLLQIDRCIRKGDINAARVMVKKINWSKLKRSDLLWFANLSRRADLPETTVKCLRNYVRPVVGEPNASDPEKLEYGAALIQLGALTEAKDLISSLSLSLKHMQLSFAYMRLWDYDAAETALRELIANSQELSSYQKLIAKINLAACLIFNNKLDLARKCLDDLAENGSGQLETLAENPAARAQWCILQSQIAIQAKQFGVASDFSTRALQILEDQKQIDASPADAVNSQELIARKWQIFSEEQTDSAPALEKFKELRQLADEQGLSELVRDCDFYSGLIAKNVPLLQKVFFGSPIYSYRSMIKRSCTEWGFSDDQCRAIFESRHYFYRSNDINDCQDNLAELDLLAWTLDGKALPDRGKNIHRLVFRIAFDLYRPPLRGEIFSYLFPDQHYEFENAKLRLSSLVFRANALGEKLKIFNVYSKARRFYITFSESCRVKMSQDANLLVLRSAEEIELALIRDHFQHFEFSIAEVTEFLQFGKTKARKILDHGIAAGQIERIGSGPRTLYRFIGDS